MSTSPLSSPRILLLSQNGPRGSAGVGTHARIEKKQQRRLRRGTRKRPSLGSPVGAEGRGHTGPAGPHREVPGHSRWRFLPCAEEASEWEAATLARAQNRTPQGNPPSSRGRPGRLQRRLKVTAARPTHGPLRSPFERRSGARVGGWPRHPIQELRQQLGPAGSD